MVMKRRLWLIGGGLVALGTRWASVAPAAETFEVVHTEAEWRKLLTPEQFAILRQSATERPSRARCFTRNDRARFPARDATSTCFPHPRNSTVGRDGQASGRRLTTPLAQSVTEAWG